VADDFTVRGTGDFIRLSKALKAAGRTELRKELHKGMRKAARPLIPKARAEARARLPQSGGLADQVAREPARVQVRTGRDPGVRVVIGRKRGGARQANRGVIRHPVFGNRDVWVDQRVRPGWFDDPMRGEAPAIRRDVLRAMDDVADQVVRDAKR
jgi:hypothetical protein